MRDANKPIGSNLGFSVLPKDTLTYGQLEPGSERQTFRSLDDRLSHRRPKLGTACLFFPSPLLCVRAVARFGQKSLVINRQIVWQMGRVKGLRKFSRSREYGSAYYPGRLWREWKRAKRSGSEKVHLTCSQCWTPNERGRASHDVTEWEMETEGCEGCTESRSLTGRRGQEEGWARGSTGGQADGVSSSGQTCFRWMIDVGHVENVTQLRLIQFGDKELGMCSVD